MKGYPPPLLCWGAKICAPLVKLIRGNLFFLFGRFISSKDDFDFMLPSQMSSKTTPKTASTKLGTATKPSATSAFPRLMPELEMTKEAGTATLTNVLWGFGALRADGKATDCKLICRFVKNESTPVKVGCKAGRKQLRAVANDAQEAVLNDLWAAEDAAQMVLKQLKKAASEMAWIEQSRPMTDRYSVLLDIEVEPIK